MKNTPKYHEGDELTFKLTREQAKALNKGNDIRITLCDAKHVSTHFDWDTDKPEPGMCFKSERYQTMYYVGRGREGEHVFYYPRDSVNRIYQVYSTFGPSTDLNELELQRVPEKDGTWE